jgi:hypothetical protein
MALALTSSEISFNDANIFYEKYEHLGNTGRGVYHWGAFYNQRLVGAVSFGSPSFNPHRGILGDLATRYEVKVYQLTRGGTSSVAPRFAASWLVSRGLKQLKKCKGDCIVAAYSDPCFNEIGTIYQSANFIYIGRTNPKGQSDYIIHNRRLSGWIVRRKFGTRDMTVLREIDPNVVKIPLGVKFRYVYPAVSRLKKRKILKELSPFSLTYPKRKEEGILPMNTPDLIRKRKMT